MSERSSSRADGRSGAVSRVTALAKTYPGGDVALAGVDLELERGTVVALAGPNGAGKSTLARILSGELAPSAGTVRVLDRDPLGAPAALRARVACIGQDVELDPELSGRETFALLAALAGLPRRAQRERVAALAGEFGLGAHLDKRVEAYSGGLKRRLHVALAFLGAPELCILDEPTTGLDRDGRDALWTRLGATARAGASVLVLTHDLADIARHCDWVVVLSAGRVVADGAPDELVRAHARRRVEILLAPGDDPGPLRRALPDAAIRGAAVVVDLADGAPLEPVLRGVEQSGVRPREIKVREPDLDGAYAALIGAAADPAPGERRRRSA